MNDPLTYAIVGGPPDDWSDLRVVDAAGNQIADVVEVNAAEGWLVRYKRNEAGEFCIDGDELVRERIEGNFRIVRSEGNA